jgi:hypothetical protein
MPSARNPTEHRGPSSLATRLTFADTKGMKKPMLRVTKWLGDIPVEAECTACAARSKFQAASMHHRPNHAEYQEQLQRAFDRHLKEEHSNSPF